MLLRHASHHRCLASAVLLCAVLRPRGQLPRRGQAAGAPRAASSGHRQRRIPRPRRRLRRLPHGAGRQAVRRRPRMPTPFGNLYVPNITPDDETGIGKWTADEFYRMMHTGVSRDGALLYPAMPFASYTKVTRADSRRDLRLPDVGAAGAAEEPPARAALSRSTSASSWSAGARSTSRKASTSPTRSSRRMEPRRLPGAGPRPLRDVPHARSTRSAASASRRRSRAG